MSEPGITRLFPLPAVDGLGDAQIAELYTAGAERRPWLRVNFVTSVDGAATHQGLSGGLSDDADKRVFAILRRLCDVVVVGAGTVRAEGYSAMRVDAASERWRTENGMSPHPVFAIVSAGLDLDPASPIFADAPNRPIILTTERSRPQAREALADVADVAICGRDRVEADALVRVLGERGLGRIHCEGGPHLFGDLIAAGTLDELCLTVSPRLEAGVASRISAGASPIVPVGLRLAHTLLSGDTLLLRYTRA
ncbi:pyrimidine reductase family protein [Leifsonia poae]|uniref:pyrimidine reductase family protein n=1 Tax=Leifsonia poae TaxID=110933 RepID=UPI001CBE4476|nr:pyrimidine reductase family protein [Leifsonia poae]